jgi:hypothetical protein
MDRHRKNNKSRVGKMTSKAGQLRKVSEKLFLDAVSDKKGRYTAEKIPPIGTKKYAIRQNQQIAYF